MQRLLDLYNKNEKYVIGLMSGTSVDGIDAVLVRITGNYTGTNVEEISFENFSFPKGIRERIFNLFEYKTSSSKDISHMNFLLGELFADAAINITKKAGMELNQIDLIGSHGQTIYHIPEAINEYGHYIRSTLQIGEGAVIAHKTGVVTVSDFRVMDMAAGGLGAPLVPYTEFLLYSSSAQTIALQNIGGIGNITVIPKNSPPNKIIAFDTGPGNMVIDFIVSKITNGSKIFDDKGYIGSLGVVNYSLLNCFMENNYFKQSPPKTTGRELFGKEFSEKFYNTCINSNMKDEDIMATATALTAKSIAFSCEKFIPFYIDKIIISGGGSYNLTLLKMIQEFMPSTLVTTQESLGLNSDSKEAVAFAILANETISGNTNNLPSVTGAKTDKILGKINL